MKLTKVLVVDDQDLIRQMLVEWFRSENRFEVVGSALSADPVMDMVERCRPDVVLMDIDMPGLDCFEAARNIIATFPGTHVIFLSAHVQDRYIDAALGAGAMGYLTKNEPPERVVQAVADVADGRAAYSEKVRARLVVDARGPHLLPGSTSRAATLSPREREVLRYVARGLATKEMALLMHVSVKTIDNHRSNIMDKLDIHDRVELALFAIREGLAEL